MNHFEMALLGSVAAYTGILMYAVHAINKQRKKLQEAYAEIELLDKFNRKFQEMLAVDRRKSEALWQENSRLRRELGILRTTDYTAKQARYSNDRAEATVPARHPTGGWVGPEVFTQSDTLQQNVNPTSQANFAAGGAILGFAGGGATGEWDPDVSRKVEWYSGPREGDGIIGAVPSEKTVEVVMSTQAYGSSPTPAPSPSSDSCNASDSAGSSSCSDSSTSTGGSDGSY